MFVDFNATFDWAFVNFYFHEYLGENSFRIGDIDVKSYYMGLSGGTWEDTRSTRIPKNSKIRPIVIRTTRWTTRLSKSSFSGGCGRNLWEADEAVTALVVSA